VIRDHDSDSPFEDIKSSLSEDIKSLWTDIEKPKQYGDKKLADFFNIEFVGLPSKRYLPNEFAERALALRQRFERDGLLSADGSSFIPINRLTSYMQSTWKVIRRQDDLSLPSQQSLVPCEQKPADIV